MERMKELGKRGSRYACSHNLKKPEIRIRVVAADNWRKEPKAAKGAYLYKDDDGQTVRSGVSDVTGYPWQEYYEIFEEGKHGDGADVLRDSEVRNRKRGGRKKERAAAALRKSAGKKGN